MIIKPLRSITTAAEPTIFLAGSIEMGAARDWQADAAKLFSETGWTVLNPRRDDWDSSWEQNVNNPQFRTQVEWEIDALTLASFKLFWFEPSTKSPITLMELGMFCRSVDAHGRPTCAVVCPESFWRHGNVDIVCRRFNVPQFDTLEQVHAHFTKLHSP